MRSLMKVGFSLLLLAAVLVALSYSMLKASGTVNGNVSCKKARPRRQATASIWACMCVCTATSASRTACGSLPP